MKINWTKWQTKEFKGKSKGISGIGKWRDKRKIRYDNYLANPYQLEEGIILSDEHIDGAENKTENQNVGYHYISLLNSGEQLYFTFQFKEGWRILSDDCLSFVKDVKTRKEAEEILLSKIA